MNSCIPTSDLDLIIMLCTLWFISVIVLLLERLYSYYYALGWFEFPYRIIIRHVFLGSISPLLVAFEIEICMDIDTSKVTHSSDLYNSFPEISFDYYNARFKTRRIIKHTSAFRHYTWHCMARISSTYHRSSSVVENITRALMIWPFSIGIGFEFFHWPNILGLRGLYRMIW
jgi:hypothetical protein